ncbi:MAG: hypothetical protein JWO92_656 [Chitinophagaceae bacterium]|nr:hypothetical protein [Chitinophagaceae bacterium]
MMKNKNSLKWLITFLAITIAAFTQDSFAQSVTKRLPDGTVVYSDGTVRLPNGQVRYPNTTNGNTYPSNYPDYQTRRYPRTATRQNDGSIIYPDGRIVYADGTVRYPDGRVYSPSNNSRWIPPGQAKKMYGSKSARDYAPGHNKGWKNNGHGKGKNKHDD